MIDFDDHKLVDQICAGNQKAFESLFLKYYEKLCNYALGILNDINASEEIVQDLFLHVWEKRAEMEIKTSVKAYLFRSVQNRSFNHLAHLTTRQNYRKKIIHDEQGKPVDFPLTEDYPEASLINKEMENEFLNALSSLPRQCKKVFELCRFDNLTYKEVAQKLNITENTVKTQMKRAIAKLREALKAHFK